MGLSICIFPNKIQNMYNITTYRKRFFPNFLKLYKQYIANKYSININITVTNPIELSKNPLSKFLDSSISVVL